MNEIQEGLNLREKDDGAFFCSYLSFMEGYRYVQRVIERSGQSAYLLLCTMTDGKGVDKVVIAGGGVETFAEAVKCLKPGGKIGNVNYLGSGDNIDIPRVEWGVGMGHKQINGGLMPGGRLRMEKLGALVSAGKLDVSPLSTHVFDGLDHLEEAMFLMRDKPKDLIKPVVKLAD